MLATVWDFLEGRAQEGEGDSPLPSSPSPPSSKPTNIAVFNLSSTRRPDLRDARVREQLGTWVPERFLAVAEAVQEGLMDGRDGGGARGDDDDDNIPTLYVAGDVDACRACNVDRVRGWKGENRQSVWMGACACVRMRV